MKPDCSSVTEVRRFLGACAFYHIWIPHYAHVAEPLYGWRDEHTESVWKMKEALAAAPALRKALYRKDTPIYVTVDTSPTGIGWVVNQEDEDDLRFPIRFGAKVLNERQRGYAQVKTRTMGYHFGGEG